MGRTRNRHNAAFVVGSVLGGLAGAAVALWKTPYSGTELRERLGAGGAAAGSGTGEAPRYSSKLLSTVESTLAPVVGVKLGQTANQTAVPSGAGPSAAPGTSSGELEPTGLGHAASTEELTTPQVDTVPEALKEEQGEPTPFPKLGGSGRPI